MINSLKRQTWDREVNGWSLLGLLRDIVFPKCMVCVKVGHKLPW